MALLGTDLQSGNSVHIGDVARQAGLYVLGRPGMGKTNLLLNLIRNDIQRNNGLFFIDPHGDAINDLLTRGKRGADYYILDPEDEQYSFGINLVACQNVDSFQERNATYDRARWVFYKIFESEFGERPWLELIIIHTLQVFIENQGYTLAEAPLFLTDAAFRHHLLRNVKHNPTISSFWENVFHPAQAEAALTRLTTFLADSRVRHIVGQRTTVDFAKMMQDRHVVFVSLPANMAPDIKIFIGTILISELLQAARRRPENSRNQFGVFVDEFQQFATEDFASLITEARKFGVATTMAHQERAGQLEQNPKTRGATSAAAKKVFFQLTVADAQELAPEFAELATEQEPTVRAVFSPHPVEALWDRGHPDVHVKTKNILSEPPL